MPASDILFDGSIQFTPGISERSGAGQDRYYNDDALGSVTDLTDASGAILSTRKWDAFGNLSGSSSYFRGWNESSGYEEDSVSGLKLLGYRHYDPSIGRFLTMDPIGDGSNWYVYCGNNPVTFSDPMGLQQRPFNQEERNGLLTGYPIDQSVYDWAIESGRFKVKKELHTRPSFIGSFTTAYQPHAHSEEGALDESEVERLVRHSSPELEGNLPVSCVFAFIASRPDGTTITRACANPSAVFSSISLAESWISKYALTGVLAEHAIADLPRPEHALSKTTYVAGSKTGVRPST